MIKNTSIILLFLFFTFTGKAQETINKAQVRTNWSGIHCRGTNGLCSIENNNQQANTKLVYKNDNTLTFIIDRNKLSESQVLQILKEQLTEASDLDNFSYTMVEDFLLDTAVQDQLKLNQSTLSKGVYPIKITDNSFIILFNLK